MLSLTTQAKTDLGKALFANSITLTPGTVTVDVDGLTVQVHALVRETSPPSSFQPMDRLASRAADGRGRTPKAKG
jgi:multicomponent Na+:H+ antiporter subunit E